MKRKLLYSLLLVFAGGMAMAQNNTSTGTNAGNGSGSSGGLENSSFGYNAGDVVTGDFNSFFGSGAGSLLTSGGYNSVFGANAGSNMTGYYNTFVGESSGRYSTTGNANTAVGRNSLSGNTTGTSNVSIGYYSGLNNNANANTYVGTHTGQFNVSGTLNTFIGYRAGHTSTGSNNLFLGSYAGYYETGSDKLYIDNSDTTTPLIWGDFSNNYVNINGSFGIGTSSPSEAFHVVGGARFASLTQDTLLTRVMVTNTNGKVYWRDASTLSGAGDNLGNHIATQSITALVNNSYDIGSSSANFKDIYFGGKLYVGSYQYFKTGNVGSNLSSVYIGEDAGVAHTSSANSNVGIGYHALYSSTDGDYNVAVGSLALEANTTGVINTAVGAHALKLVTSGYSNTAVGFNALNATTTGNINTAVGAGAMESNTTGYGNTAVGLSALHDNTSGICNTAVGNSAAFTGNYSNSTAIGYDATITASNQVRIGDANVSSIGGQVSWSTLSDGRFKKSVKQDVAGLDFILKLNPVSYVVDRNAVDNFLGIPQERRAKQRPQTERQTGFIAQDVEEIVKKSSYAFYGVDAPKSDQDHYGIRYSEFVVPLVKAVQELDSKVNAQQALIEEQRQLIDKQQEMLTALLAREPGKDGELPATGAVLYQNHPNPARNGETQITMDIPAGVNEAVVNVYDINGKTLDRVTVSARGNGVSVTAGVGKLTPGIYLYSLVVDGRIAGVKKMVMAE